MKNIVILISGNGSNMQAIVRTAQQDDWQRRYQARIAAVISNNPHAGGLEFAKRSGIVTQVVDHKNFSDRTSFDKALQDTCDAFAPHLVVLAGFMRILGADFVTHFARRLLNIHPSLLPAFPGLETHRKAIDMGCKVAGATVHEVTAQLDHGPILAQAVVPILPDDTPTTLQARVLSQEHLIYPAAIAARLAQR